jgi:hypothetical protein
MSTLHWERIPFLVTFFVSVVVFVCALASKNTKGKWL